VLVTGGYVAAAVGGDAEGHPPGQPRVQRLDTRATPSAATSRTGSGSPAPASSGSPGGAYSSRRGYNARCAPPRFRTAITTWTSISSRDGSASRGGDSPFGASARSRLFHPLSRCALACIQSKETSSCTARFDSSPSRPTRCRSHRECADSVATAARGGNMPPR
jgi:hypothetical protein